MAESKIAQKGPFVLEVESGTYAWCQCGRSDNQPYCDGSHKGTGIKPEVVEIEEDKQIAWCGCKQSDNAPFCDGTHHEL